MTGALELLTVYLGERLGLYQALHADGPATSAELAARTGTTERYIREWLEHHAASGLLEVDDPAGDQRRHALTADRVPAPPDGSAGTPPSRALRRAIHLPASQPRSRTTAARNANPHWAAVSWVVPSR